MTCSCVNVDIGSYDNATTLPNPAHQRVERAVVSVDTCLVAEITALWMAGIHTRSCCCGHNKTAGHVGVDDEDVPRMLALGYLPQRHPAGLKNFFWPKSLAYSDAERAVFASWFDQACVAQG